MKHTISKILAIVGINIVLFVSLDLLAGTAIIPSLGRQYYLLNTERQRRNSNRVGDCMYNHGFIPNSTIPDYDWGGSIYPIYVNSLGLRDRSVRTVPLVTNAYRILLLGDSYIEGVGFPYDQTVAGLLSNGLGTDEFDILNAGVQSYSPKIYLQKTKFLLDTMHLTVNEIVIFLDLSDIHNEYYTYRNFHPSDTTNVLSATTSVYQPSLQERAAGFFIDHSLFVNILYQYTQIDQKQPNLLPYEADYQAWTYDADQYATFGKEGLELCKQYLHELVGLARSHSVQNIVLVVYPWPEQIQHNDINSIQEQYWRSFSDTEHIRFIDLFPQFFAHTAAGESLFLPDDHWNAEGNMLVADTLLRLDIASGAGTPTMATSASTLRQLRYSGSFP